MRARTSSRVTPRLKRALDLLFLRAGNQDEPVEAPVAAGFNKDGRLDDGDPFGFTCCVISQQLFLKLNYARMDDPVQSFEQFGFAEHARGQRAAVDPAIRLQNHPFRIPALLHGTPGLPVKAPGGRDRPRG